MQLLAGNKMKVIANFVLFQVGWFVCVYSVAQRAEWLAITGLIIVIAIHLSLVKGTLNELQIIFIAGMAGLIIDTALIFLNIFSPVSIYMVDGLAPVWLVGLWMLFGITLNHSLAWLQKRYLISAILGSIFAPVAYYAGHQIGALQFSAEEPVMGNLLMIGFCWFFVTPLLLAMARGYRFVQLEHNHI